jgi:ABC-type Na+ efflux pump permease subunit
MHNLESIRFFHLNGIDAKSSMKKAELIDLLENATTSERLEAASEVPELKPNTESEAKPSASQPVFLVVGVFIALAILAWIIL